MKTPHTMPPPSDSAEKNMHGTAVAAGTVCRHVVVPVLASPLGTVPGSATG